MRSRPFTHPLITRGGPGRFAIRQSSHERLAVGRGRPSSEPLAACRSVRPFPNASWSHSGDAWVMSVLVVYASRHGATAEIAGRIASRLGDAGAAIELRRVDEVATLSDYDAVIFGAPVYDQSWPPEANSVRVECREALSTRPLWLFSVGSFGDTKRLIGPLTHKEPKGIEEILARPAATRVSRLPRRHPEAPVAVLVARLLPRLRWTLRRPPRLARRSTPGPTGSQRH